METVDLIKEGLKVRPRSTYGVARYCNVAWVTARNNLMRLKNEGIVTEVHVPTEKGSGYMREWHLK